VPVKTNSQTTQTHSNQNSAKNTEIPPLLLLHQEVTEVQMLQYPLPAKGDPQPPPSFQVDLEKDGKGISVAITIG